METLVRESPALASASLAVVGMIVGGVLRPWIIRLVPLETPSSRTATWFTVFGTGLLFGAFAWAVLVLRCQDTPEVRPGESGVLVRLYFHLILLALLVAATGTDLRDYLIPDQITIAGVLIAIIGATATGNVQLIHIWVDWNQEVPGLHGPYLPAWLDAHQHLHGLAWSVAGLVAGGGITWFVRAAAGFILGRPAMGFGDVTLMAMIGSFIGWQPIIVTFLLAPLCGIVIAPLARLLTGRSFLPYGPYLAAAAVIVLFTWRWIWMFESRLGATRLSMRLLFGDVTSLLILGGVATASLIALLVLLRLYRAIPVERAQAAAEEKPDSSAQL